eukprot:GILK01000149.1.p1 GENE.GILK01000149.1~~GILK01000149.1.p1  ORF type:complete len:1077 (+),score=234.49 GILK01000149.1:103-3333(+)
MASIEMRTVGETAINVNLVDHAVNPSPFRVDRDALTNLIEHRDNREKYDAMGGLPGIAQSLLMDLKVGLSSKEAPSEPSLADRKRVFGINKRSERKSKSFWTLVWTQLQDMTLRILLVAASISLGVGIWKEGPEEGWIEGVAVYVAVLIVVSVASFNDWMKDKQFRALSAVRDDRPVSVFRDGHVEEVSVHDLVVGDIMLLNTGDQLPCDGIIIEAHNLNMDEASMTGESKLLRKAVPTARDPGDPFCLSGTQVMEGTGKMLVIAVGDWSLQGKTMALLQVEPEPTPLQLKLERIAGDIGKLGLIAACLTVLALFVRFTVMELTCKSHQCEIEGKGWRNSMINQWIDFLIIGITVVVVAVPEGLPLAVTIALAYSVKKMLKENNLVRHLDACETMGGADQICSDKTGTLTQNRMTVMQLWLAEQMYKTVPEGRTLNQDVTTLLCEGIACNSTASIRMNPETHRMDHIGNKTECALLQLCANFGFNYEQIREKYAIEHVYSFSSARKRMSTVVKLADGRFRVFVKGASEIVLDQCTEVLDAHGHPRKLQAGDKATWKAGVIEPLAQQALRTLCLAYKDIDGRRDWEHDWADQDTPNAEKDMICIGIVGIEDPVRDEVPPAVKKCHQAGITVRMVTGDNLTTAKAIGKDCGIYHPETGGLAMEGPEFVRMVGGLVCKTCRTTVCDCARDNTTAKKTKKPLRVDTIAKGEEFDKVWPYLEVLARSRPEDKYCLVTGLMERGQVVAVTGDGTNDGPALKKANVGFAMGITGTEVAKEASDIILLDDNFTSIVKAVMWGRNVYDNIRKFLQFQLTVNVVAVVTAFFGAVLMKESPLTAVQMLWVNLIMDTFASLALATESPTDELLRRKPYSRGEYLVTPTMWRNIIGHAIYQIAILMAIMLAGDKWFGVRPASDAPEGTWSEATGVQYTLVFHTFVFMQVFNEINARKLRSDEYNVFKGFFSNPMFLLIICGTIGVQILLVQVGGQAMKTSPLTVEQHIYCILLGFGSLIVGFLIKFVPITPFTKIKIDEKPMTDQERKSGVVTKLRKSSQILKQRYSSGPTSLTQEHPMGRKASKIGAY